MLKKSKKMVILKISSILLVILLLLNGCQKEMIKSTPTEKMTYALDTMIKISLYDSSDEALIDECFSLCADYEKKFSRTKEESEIYQLNQKGKATVSDDTLELIEKGLYYSKLSNGNFDITIEPVSSLWNFTAEDASLPDEKKLKEAVNKVNYKKVKINGNTVSFEEKGMGIDLGAIAKGYIADKMKTYLIEHGVTSAVINLGGNVLCIGNNPNGEKFSIGVQKPEKNSTEVALVLSIADQSVVSSGTYERYISVNGKDYHHILNPATGYSYENGLSEVTIISEKSVDGDGLSTTCFSLGLEKGMELIDSINQVWAVFIDNQGEIYYSDGFKENIKVK